MRAMTFERLVRDDAFASQTATTVIGAIGLDRPSEVVVVNARTRTDRTAELLAAAHARAVDDEAATLIYQLAVPFVGYEDRRATDVLPDFAVVASKGDGQGSWLLVGDAKDYERHRSRVEDSRLLKGFLQVAVGAESVAAWSQLPQGMDVHGHGALAVPRNAFLQPEALVDDIGDHRMEVQMRIEERRRLAKATTFDERRPVREFVDHLEATFDPTACPSCALFVFCRSQLRQSSDPTDLLIEIGVPKELRQHVVGILDGTGAVGSAAPPSLIANVEATNDGRARWSNQRRIDPIGLAGTVNVVIAKSDAASLGVHGMAVQRVTADGPGAWVQHVFEDPQGSGTRKALMRILGTEISALLKDRRRADPAAPQPVHMVVPDKMTADVLVSIADNLAGVELSRLRWARDKQMGRPQLTYNGETASVPAKLSETERTAVSFLLEDDRARALTMRSPIVNAQAVLARHLVAGGPMTNSARLDYLVAWLSDTAPIDHRAAADEIETLPHTPGARLANATSNSIHTALAGERSRRKMPGGVADPARYEALVHQELDYKASVLDHAVVGLARFPVSALQDVHRAIEGSAQEVWRRRLKLHASDLVRFGRTYRHWRNSQVPTIETDAVCRDQLLALANPQAAQDLATDAGSKYVSHATVLSVDPLVLDIESRRVEDGTRVVLLHVGDEACVEGPDIAVKHQATSFRFSGLSIGPLTREGVEDGFPGSAWLWRPATSPSLAVGDRVVVAHFSWFSDARRNNLLTVGRPAIDRISAPTIDCDDLSYANDHDAHRYCCRPHEDAEAEWSDELAERRARGQLNPEVWPPVRDGDAFEVSASGAPIGDPFALPPEGPPADATIDDLE